MNPVQGFLIEILYDLDIQQRKLIKGCHCQSFTDMSTMWVNFESDTKRGLVKYPGQSLYRDLLRNWHLTEIIIKVTTTFSLERSFSGIRSVRVKNSIFTKLLHFTQHGELIITSFSHFSFIFVTFFWTERQKKLILIQKLYLIFFWPFLFNHYYNVTNKKNNAWLNMCNDEYKSHLLN